MRSEGLAGGVGAGARGNAPAGSPWRAGVVAGSHTVVDLFSAVVIPIVSVLVGRVGGSPEFQALLIASGSLASGLIQPVLAWLGDKLDTRWFGTLGFGVCVLAIGLVGFVTEPWQLLLLQIVGSAGSGAFHPVAAAAMGQLSGSRRTRGVAIFFGAGMIGAVVGSAGAPWFARALGIEALAWGILPGLLCVLAMAIAIHSVGHINKAAAQAHLELPDAQQRERWRAVWLLYAGNVLRFTVNMMLVQLFIKHAEGVSLARAGSTELTMATRSASTLINGPLQASMQAGMGLGGLALGALLARAHEGRALVVVPMLGAGAIACFPLLSVGLGEDGQLPWAGMLVALMAGLGFAGLMPTTISLAQRLLPHRAGLASGLMMGGAWGLAAMGPPAALGLVRAVGLQGAFLATACVLAVSGALAWGGPLRRLAGRA